MQQNISKSLLFFALGIMVLIITVDARTELCRHCSALCFVRVALSIIQRNIRRWLAMRNWQWWKLYTRVKPLLSVARQEDEMKKKEEELEKTKQELAKVSKIKKELEEQNVTLLQTKSDLFLQLQAEQDNVVDLEERIAQLVNQKGDYEEQVCTLFLYKGCCGVVEQSIKPRRHVMFPFLKMLSLDLIIYHASAVATFTVKTTRNLVS